MRTDQAAMTGQSNLEEAREAAIHLRVAGALRDIGADGWQSLAGTTRGCSQADIDVPYNPFLSYAFLTSLEESGCVSAETGWLPQHLVLEDPANRKVLGALPCYLKNHSQGEYVFDHGWADALERAGGRYYPKLQSSVPFTPATGPRLLAPHGPARPVVQDALAQGLVALAERLAVSSAHVTFIRRDEAVIFDRHGYLERTDQQFHFLNEGYGSYEEFLETLVSRKRKALRKERRAALEADIEVEWLTGDAIKESHWDAFYRFYMDTGGRKWGRPYLNRRFYSLIGERMAQDILLVMAKRSGRYIAGAINFIGEDCLYGRNWGCIEDHPYLHFEICYHQAIDYAIAHGLRRVEAGAQGEHKLARGYVPVTTRSAHYVSHPGLRRAVADYLAMERRDVDRVGALLSDHTPFRKP
jgi:uncharacterized protein